MIKSSLQSPPKLKKVLGVAFGISIVIGSTIGAGILRAPGSIASLLPNSTLILSCWFLTGIYILLCASSYAELTTMLPKAGGAFNYIERAFGTYTGFVSGWFDFIQNILAPAFFCVVLGEYTLLLFPQLAGHGTAVALSFLTIFTLINLPGVKGGSATQQVTSLLKVVLLLVLITACFFAKPIKIESISATKTPMLTGALVIDFFKAMQLILGTYDGWMSVSFFAEEDDNPGKNIPRSYFIGAITIIVLYVLFNAAILYVLPIATIAKSPLAASAAAAVVFGSWSSVFINIVSLLAVISILNAYMMIPSRILFGLSREGFFIKQGTYVNKGGTPYYCMLICYAITVIFIVFNSYEQLFGLAAVMLTVVTSFSFASLMWLRKKEPELPRPYRAWGYPYVTTIAMAVSVILFIGFAISDLRSFIIVISLFIASYPFYRLIIKANGVKAND
ncbi:APC family permease [Mucilaginibacter glaciei]|uniref:APC family permease n=1 Tax=Mucilaginibacter glaciei TaxID=2772109 RepID=A0A926NPC5_9SPHI|nr:APC family permease [Mucilaginibacter glaciei]MBD1392597.1 APC family permease [Mucilaginibacter glaciei]